MRKALVSGGVARQVADFNPSNIPDWASDWVDVPDSVGIGSVWEGENWSDPPDPAPNETDVRAEHTRRLEAGKTFTLAGYGEGVLVEGTQTVLMDLLFRKSQADAGLSPIAWVSGGIAHSLTAAQFLELYTLALTHGDALRTAMHTIIAIDPIPADYADDSRWPS